MLGKGTHRSEHKDAQAWSKAQTACWKKNHTSGYGFLCFIAEIVSKMTWNCLRPS